MDIRNKLLAHHQNIVSANMHDLLAADPGRASRYSAMLEGLYINYSRHRITDETLTLLFELAGQSNLVNHINDMFSGKYINTTEHRPALHSALRSDNTDTLDINGVNIRKQIRDELEHMERFVSGLHQGDIRGYSDKPINTLVNLGTGGSCLGPRLVCNALDDYKKADLKIHFVANIDYRDLDNVLKKCDPEATLFVVSSKSFTTTETLANAQAAKTWLTENHCKDLAKHFIAVTANIPAAEDFGITTENIFTIWDWVGGRYSVWSATGLPVAASIGMKNFRSLLSGANMMDQHFRSSALENNIPVILGLLDIWYINYFNTSTMAIIPYDQSLEYLPEYLGQLIMESNGKSINKNNEPIEIHTSPVIWGGTGTNVQHTFMQLLHQGTHMVPVDFLIGSQCPDNEAIHHKILLANCLAHGEALMSGNIDKVGSQEMYKKVNGNNPSTTIIYEKLTPEMLGMLVAMYEHRTFVQAVIWNINPFDQWGVETGKQISKNILELLNKESQQTTTDAITGELLSYIHKSRTKK